jgi:tetratricopeptide (TPR) repeat protein
MQNWNHECADCHSTALRKGYEAEAARFDTTWADLDVGCEACHGPGSSHVEWAEAGASGPAGGLVVTLERAPPWTIEPGASNAATRPGTDHVVEIETCAPCHSRRDQLAEARRPDAPYLDSYRPELIIRRLYHHDGQIDGEVYVYGSFLQSRMFHAGVRCSDCHEPHSLSLRRENNALCSGCHAERVYDTPLHHRHEAAGSACVDCHMPSKTYMEIDARRDHSLRLPRPDLAGALGAPDPCTGCHADRGSAWAAERVAEWFGPERRPHYGSVLHAARRREARSEERLRALADDESAPAIIRGTALSLLDDFPGSIADDALRVGAQSPEPLVRLGAAYGAREHDPTARMALLRPLLDDPLLAVRIEAARTLAVTPPESLSRSDRGALSAAIHELRAAELIHADRADAWLRIALLELDRRNRGAAERALRRALRVDPRFTPALVNLADLRRMAGDEVEVEALLRRALTLDEDDAEALHALGLCLVRTDRAADALPLFEEAAALRGDNPRFRYVHAVALAEAGRRADAIAALVRGLDAHPNDPDMLLAIAEYRAEAGDRVGALEAAERLLSLRPGDPAVEGFVEGLR